MTHPDQVHGPSREVPDVAKIVHQKRVDDRQEPRKRKRRQEKKSGDQIATGDAQHDISDDGEESVDHSVDFLA